MTTGTCLYFCFPKFISIYWTFSFPFIHICGLYFQSNVIFHFCLLFIHSRDIYWTSTMSQAFFLGISFPQIHYALSQLQICLFYQNIFLYVLWDTSTPLSITSTDVTSIVFFIALATWNYILPINIPTYASPTYFYSIILQRISHFMINFISSLSPELNSTRRESWSDLFTSLSAK